MLGLGNQVSKALPFHTVNTIRKCPTNSCLQKSCLPCLLPELPTPTPHSSLSDAHPSPSRLWSLLWPQLPESAHSAKSITPFKVPLSVSLRNRTEGAFLVTRHPPTPLLFLSLNLHYLRIFKKGPNGKEGTLGTMESNDSACCSAVTLKEAPGRRASGRPGPRLGVTITTPLDSTVLVMLLSTILFEQENKNRQWCGNLCLRQ